MGLYSEENPLFEILSVLGDLIMLNLVFVCTCLPIVTIGASSAALYTVIYKMMKKENKQVLKEYWNAFRLNFKQATIIGIIFTIMIMIALVDLNILASTQNSIMIGLVYGVLFLVVIVQSYIFPLVSLFHNKVFYFFKNAVVIAFLNLPTTLFCVFLNILPLLALWFGSFILQGVVFVYLLCGFSVTAMVIMKKIIRVFEKYSQEIKIS